MGSKAKIANRQAFFRDHYLFEEFEAVVRSLYVTFRMQIDLESYDDEEGSLCMFFYPKHKKPLTIEKFNTLFSKIIAKFKTLTTKFITEQFKHIHILSASYDQIKITIIFKYEGMSLVV